MIGSFTENSKKVKNAAKKSKNKHSFYSDLNTTLVIIYNTEILHFNLDRKNIISQ